MMNENLLTFPANTVVLEGEKLLSLFHLLTPPDLDTYIRNPKDSAHLWMVLSEEYPQNHLLKLLDANGSEHSFPLADLRDGKFSVDGSVLLQIPPKEAHTSFEFFQNVVAVLRSPDGCPWDKKQTHQSLRDDFLQEVYELLDGLDRNDMDVVAEELGDVLLHIVIQAQIALESDEFNMGDVCAHISDKLIFRHEHVFSHAEKLTPEEVLDRWEKMKKKEREKEKSDQGLLDGISRAMPALSMAYSYQKRAARVGFDWDDVAGVWQKLDEEIAEFKNAQTAQERENELGDILFCLVNLARWYKVDPETALRESNLKFFDRVHYVEKRAKDLGKDLFEMPLSEKDQYWDEYKATHP